MVKSITQWRRGTGTDQMFAMLVMYACWPLWPLSLKAHNDDLYIVWPWKLIRNVVPVWRDCITLKWSDHLIDEFGYCCIEICFLLHVWERFITFVLVIALVFGQQYHILRVIIWHCISGFWWLLSFLPWSWMEKKTKAIGKLKVAEKWREI